MKNFDQIYYLDCPHFTVGRVDQWGEQGYLLFAEQVYWYEVDRKNQFDETRLPMSVEEFLETAERLGIQIPEVFMAKLREVSK